MLQQTVPAWNIFANFGSELQYIMQTFTLAIPSLTINGLDASDSVLVPNPPQTHSTPDAKQNYEPYDPRLAAKVRSLYATLETETTRVAELRREAPPKAVGLYVVKLRAEMEEEQRRVENAKLKVAKLESLDGLNVKFERAAEVAVSWERGVEELDGLRGITEGVARLERARGVVQELESM